MTQQDKSRMYNALKAAGVHLDKPYRNYTEDELRPAYDQLVAAQPDLKPEPAQPAFDPAGFAAAFEQFAHADENVTQPAEAEAAEAFFDSLPPAEAEVRRPELAGERLNTQGEDEVVLRTDELGRMWLQEEVLKPATPRPRGRRVLTVQHHDTRQVTVQDGQYTESFEIADERGPQRTSEIKITMPSYQVGIFRDQRFPMFRVHTYNGLQGFNLFDVEEFYGGAELVPATCKRMYVSNDLCYDIRSVVQAITDEHRQNALQGRY